jgi:hypothetical protein
MWITWKKGKKILGVEGANIGMKCRRGRGNTGNFSYHLTAILYNNGNVAENMTQTANFRLVYMFEAIQYKPFSARIKFIFNMAR